MATPIRALLGGALLLAATPALAGPFDGTWKGDPKSATLDVKPDQVEIKGGTFSCKTCIPPYATPADGKFHPVADRPYWDEVAVTIVDDRTVRMQMKKGGKLVAENTRTVSADGNSLAIVTTNTANGAGTRVDHNSTQTRVGTPVAGAHLTSGSWKSDPTTNEVSANAMTITVKVDGGRLYMKSPLGETLDAKLGGDYAAVVGDPGKTMTKAAMPAPDRLELTDMRGGKIVQITTYTVSADGKTLTGAWTDPRDGSKGTFQATKM